MEEQGDDVLFVLISAVKNPYFVRLTTSDKRGPIRGTALHSLGFRQGIWAIWAGDVLNLILGTGKSSRHLPMTICGRCCHAFA